MSIKERLRWLGLELPPVPKSVAAYVPAVAAGSLVFSSGQLPFVEGRVIYQGRAGADYGTEAVYRATKVAVLNALAAIEALSGDLDRIVQVVKLTGYIQSTNNFHDQAAGLNGASELLLELFAERGRHARVAVGVASLPLNALCEIELVLEILSGKDGSRS